MDFLNLHDILNAKEGENLEFKEKKTHFDFDECVKYACAIANRGGGGIVYGVTDKRPRQIVGTTAPQLQQPEDTCRSLMERLGLRIDFRLFEESGNKVVVLIIPPRPFGLPIRDKGRDKGTYWWRDGDSLISMPPEVLRDIFAEGGHDFSADICPDATPADLDDDAVSEFRERVARRSVRQDLATLPTEQFLSDYGVLVGGAVTYAALIMFGTAAALGRHLSQCEVIFEYHSTEASVPAQQRVEFRRGFLSYFDELWKLINLRNTLQHYQNGLFIEYVPTFDEETVREAIMNAVCHRDYQLGGSVRIYQYPRELVIQSPGGFPPGVTSENILNQCTPRNRRVAELLSRCGLVERAGHGMNVIFERSIRQAKNLPNFRGTDRSQVQLTLDGLVQDPTLLVMMERIGKETLQTFNTEDFLLVNRIHGEKAIPKELRPRISRLMELGVIERAGRNHYVMSKRYYAEAGRKGVYTRKKGLDREEHMALIQKHIQENAQEGTPLSELCQMITSRSPRQIQNLLKKLQDQGVVTVVGKTKAGRWYPVSEKKP